jgi:hypothetical protein
MLRAVGFWSGAATNNGVRRREVEAVERIADSVNKRHKPMAKGKP